MCVLWKFEENINKIKNFKTAKLKRSGYNWRINPFGGVKKKEDRKSDESRQLRAMRYVSVRKIVGNITKTNWATTVRASFI